MPTANPSFPHSPILLFLFFPPSLPPFPILSFVPFQRSPLPPPSSPLLLQRQVPVERSKVQAWLQQSLHQAPAELGYHGVGFRLLRLAGRLPSHGLRDLVGGGSRV